MCGLYSKRFSERLFRVCQMKAQHIRRGHVAQRIGVALTPGDGAGEVSKRPVAVPGLEPEHPHEVRRLTVARIKAQSSEITTLGVRELPTFLVGEPRRNECGRE